jgi:hypothetical protein
MWDEMLTRLEAKYGASSMVRIKKILSETVRDRAHRHPLQARAAYILPDLSDAMIIDMEKHQDLRLIKDRFSERHPEIRGEILSYLEKTGRPEVHGGYRPEVHGGYDNYGGEEWRVVYLNRIGREDVAVTQFFPATMSYLRECHAILFPVGGILFSVLEPGAHIPPHSDRTNVFVHLHQTIVTPADCMLKVGDMEIVFEEQKSYLFDPSFVHEAWNRSSRDRIHLILPVWHPGTTLPERDALTEIFLTLRD